MAMDGYSQVEECSQDSLGFVHIEHPLRGPSKYESCMGDSADTSIPKYPNYPRTAPDWSNLKVIHRNTLPPRASFHIYDNSSNAQSRNPSKIKALCLSGIWKFNWVTNPFDAPQSFHSPGYDSSEWRNIEVPGMWQLQGYGKGPQ